MKYNTSGLLDKNLKLQVSNNFIPGVVALIVISAMLFALTNVREKEMETMDLLLVASLSPSYHPG